MIQYAVIAYDGTDEHALERRMAARPAHFEYAKQMKQAGNLINGGAILDDNGKMIGSVAFLQFETEADFEHWYSVEPYIQQGVWQNIEIKPFRLANL